MTAPETAKHSPGVWASRFFPDAKGGSFHISAPSAEYADGVFICSVPASYAIGEPDYGNGYYEKRADAEPNALLIAAAPDLLAACKRVMQLQVTRNDDEAFAQVRAAIAKAGVAHG